MKIKLNILLIAICLLSSCALHPTLTSLSDCQLSAALREKFKNQSLSYQILYVKQDRSINLTLHAEVSGSNVIIAALSEFGQKLFVSTESLEGQSIEKNLMWRYEERPEQIVNYFYLSFLTSGNESVLGEGCEIRGKVINGSANGMDIFSNKERIIRKDGLKDPSGKETIVMHDFQGNAVIYINEL